MNHEAVQSFRFWDTLDNAISKKRYSGERRSSLYPSEASVVAIDPEDGEARIMGGCLRKTWYRLLRFPQSNPPTAKSLWIFQLGNYIEDMITDWAKIAGIYDSSSVKFFDRESFVSGEIDLVIQVPAEEGYIHTEIKSTWGGRIGANGEEQGKAKSLFDHHEGRGRSRHFVKAEPKDNNLLQLVVYLYTHRDDPELLGGKLIYFLKDNSNRTEFDVTVEEQENGKHRVIVDGEVIEDYYAEDIYERYKYILAVTSEDAKKAQSGTPKEDLVPPDRDYTAIFTDEETEEKREKGNISKSAYENHMKRNNPAGDWQCSYCSFRDLCYNNLSSLKDRWKNSGRPEHA